MDPNPFTTATVKRHGSMHLRQRFSRGPSGTSGEKPRGPSGSAHWALFAPNSATEAEVNIPRSELGKRNESCPFVIQKLCALREKPLAKEFRSPPEGTTVPATSAPAGWCAKTG